MARARTVFLFFIGVKVNLEDLTLTKVFFLILSIN